MKHAVFGQGKKNLVILPGVYFKPVTDSAAALATAFAPFCNDFTIWVFDRETDRSEGYSTREMAGDTAEKMKRLGIEKADVFGASQGGEIALYMAIDHPELVNRLVLGSTGCRNNESSRNIFRKWNALAREGNIEDLISLSLEQIYSEATLRDYKSALFEANRDMSDSDLALYRIMTDALVEFDCSDELDQVRCPTLVIGCEGDRVYGPELSRELAEKLGAELFMYGDTYGHGVYDEAPDYRERFFRFLNE